MTTTSDVEHSSMSRTRTVAEVGVGQSLHEFRLDVTPTLVVSTALATRDFQDVHHDRDLAQQKGSKDIFLNILTTTGLVQRYVTDWAGPQALVRGVSVRLGVPCYAYDNLAFYGQVIDQVVEDGETRHIVDVLGRDSLGDHVKATVRIALPQEES